jgi:hypothetical protein
MIPNDKTNIHKYTLKNNFFCCSVLLRLYESFFQFIFYIPPRCYYNTEFIISF